MATPLGRAAGPRCPTLQLRARPDPCHDAPMPTHKELIDAALADDAERVRALAGGGAPVGESDVNGWTALHFAAHAGALHAAEALLDLGADPNAVDRFGKPPLFRAVFERQPEMVQLLRRRGADPLLGGVAHMARRTDNPTADAFADLPDPLPEPREAALPEVMTQGEIPPGPPDARWQDEHVRLWKLLVPRSGAAPTTQGEVVRCTGRLADEAYRNGNVNWGPRYEAMCSFLERTLADAGVFSAAELEELRAAIGAIVRDHEHPDVSGPGSAYYRLSELGVRWCLAKRTLTRRLTLLPEVSG